MTPDAHQGAAEGPEASAARERLAADDRGEARWRRWGPYLSDRQWGTVREDYSADGNAWRPFPWNGHDPFLKERLSGLSGPEGNHGEDVKEICFHRDSTPCHSWMRALYRYPHGRFPYEELVAENGRRGRDAPEYELLDTGIFAGDRFCDIEVTYAQGAPDDILIRLSVTNRGHDPHALHLLPTLWFRNTWSWGGDEPRPRSGPFPRSRRQGPPRRLFGAANAGPFVKDGINDRVVAGERGAVNPEGIGTKASLHYVLPLAGGNPGAEAAAGGSPAHGRPPWRGLRGHLPGAAAGGRRLLRSPAPARAAARAAGAAAPGLCRPALEQADLPLRDPGVAGGGSGHATAAVPPPRPQPPVAAPLCRRRAVHARWMGVPLVRRLGSGLPLCAPRPGGSRLRQAPARPADPGVVPAPQRPAARLRVGLRRRQPARARLGHLAGVQPGETGERPRRPTLPGAGVPEAAAQLHLVGEPQGRGGQQHLPGRLPRPRQHRGVHRSAPLPTGGFIEQSDGTSWMGMFCLNMLTISLELAQENPVYEDMATKFFEHFLYIAAAMNASGSGGGHHLWDDGDGFFHDVLHLPDGQRQPLKIRSMVGLIPLFAIAILEPEVLERLPAFQERLEWFIRHRPDLKVNVACMETRGQKARRLLALTDLSPNRFVAEDRFRHLLERLFDPAEFLGDHGIRSLSRHHADHPYVFCFDGREHRVGYEPAESRSGLFGGNSNWRGPVWFPVNHRLIEALQQFHRFAGDGFQVECPTGSGQWLSLQQAAGLRRRRRLPHRCRWPAPASVP